MKKLNQLVISLDSLVKEYKSTFYQGDISGFSLKEMMAKKNHFNEKHEELRELLRKKIVVNLKELFKHLVKTKIVANDFYFSDLPLELYKLTLPESFEKYKQENKLSLPLLHDFLIEELNKIGVKYIITYDNTNVDYSNHREEIFNFQVEERKKREMLNSHISKVEKSYNDFYFDESGNLIEITESEELKRDIYELVVEYRKLIEDYESEFNYLIHTSSPEQLELEGAISEKIQELKFRFSEKLKLLYNKSVEDDFFFHDCPLKVYLNHYKNRRSIYFKENVDADEADFIKSELNKLINYREERVFFDNGTSYNYHNLLDETEFLKISLNKKIEHLENLIKELGWKTFLIDDEDGVPSFFDFERIDNSSSITTENEDSSVANENKTVEEISIQEENKISKEQKESKEGGTHKKIFVSKEGEDVFKRVMHLLNAFESKEKFKRGSIAKANAIFKDKGFSEEYLIYDTSEQNFIEYLINEFKIPKSTKKLSKGDIHEVKASLFIKELIKEQKRISKE